MTKIPGIAVLATSPPADKRLFVVMREGTIRIVKDGELLPEPFIDIADDVYLEMTVERGLLGLAFHPAYAENGQFFVYYTTMFTNVLARCSVSAADPDRAEPACVTMLEIVHDISGNHNGGMLEFGSDGFLYLGTGDAGDLGDPEYRAQNPNELLGKMLRIDVDDRSQGEYGIPPSNPYANGGGAPEVFMRGLRNPWRWSFDRLTGDMWLADVGQTTAEEMNVLRPHEQLGANLGWPMYEADGCCYNRPDRCVRADPQPCDPAGLTFPKDVRDRTTPRGAGWYAIIGGQTYRGACFPDLYGYHIYTDVVAQVVVRARLKDDDTLEIHDAEDVDFDQTSSLHAGPDGELFLTKTSGDVYQLEVAP